MPNEPYRPGPPGDPAPPSAPADAGTGSQLLSATQISALRAEAERYRSAQRQVTDALGVLWNAQLSMALQMEDADRIENTLKIAQQQRFYNNCDC